MKLRQGSYRIRNATARDASLLQSWWNDGRVMAHAGFPNGLGLSVAQITVILAQGNCLKRCLIIEHEGHPIGEMSYRSTPGKTAEIGIKICAASEQNKGHGSQFLKMLMRFLFLRRKYNRVSLDTNLKNIRAQHVYEKLGFRKVCVQQDSWKDQLGELQSSVDYEMTRDEYLRRYPEERA